MAGSVIALLISAFVTGALARFAVPGPDPMPAWLTVLIGLTGSLIGWGIILALVGPDPAWVGIAGFLASIALVVLYRHFVQRRPLFGRDAYRFPERGVGVDQYRERLQRAGIDPDRIGSPFAPPPAGAAGASASRAGVTTVAEDPTENPAHYLGLLEELHDSGVLEDPEYQAARARLLDRLR
ncbi:MAG: SHOCT domain-containing protein [Gaiellaceae bacterium]